MFSCKYLENTNKELKPKRINKNQSPVNQAAII